MSERVFEVHKLWTALAEVARREIDAGRGTAVSDRFSLAAREAISALLEELVADGVERRTAEFAVTRWLLVKDPIDECVRLEGETLRSQREPSRAV